MTDDVAYYSSLGLLVSVRCDDASLRARVDDLYAACRAAPTRAVDLELEILGAPEQMSPPVYELRAGGKSCLRTTDPDELLEWVAWKVNSAALESPRVELALHAAAVAFDGAAVVITGPSGAGKSTLASALTLAGAAYMGDDSLVVDGATAQIRSNPKPIGLDDDSRTALMRIAPTNPALRHARRMLAPHALGAVVAAGVPVPAALIVHSFYRPDISTLVTPITPAGAAAVLADQSFNFSARGADGLRAVAALARRARAIVVEFGDVVEAVDAISAAVAAPTRGPKPDTDETLGALGSELDAELLSGEVLIWNGRVRELHHLSGTATEIWRAGRHSGDAATVAARVGATTALDEIERCLADLAALGLLPVPRSSAAAGDGQDSTPR
jgi:hypothetical protein